MAGPMNPYDAVPPEQRGMSGTTKVLLAFGIGCGVLVLLCCGVFGIVGFWGANYAQKSFSDDPAKAREITDEIVKIEIPESLEAQGSVDLRVPFRGDRLMSWAIYASEDNESHLILGEFAPALADSGDFEAQLRESMRETGKSDDEDLDVLESETYNATIHDKEASFRISKAEGRQSKQTYWQVTGQFRGDAGPAILIMRLDADQFTKEQAIGVIKSMED